MFLIPFIDIKPNFPGHDFPGHIKNMIGKIKYDLDINTIMDKMYINQDFVKFVNESNYAFIPLSKDYYSNDVVEYFDIYGGSYSIIFEDIEYIIKIYFYKIKKNELITQAIINKFKTIFQYDYFVKNNILNMTWHNYAVNHHLINNLNGHKTKFLDLSFNSERYTTTKLFNHQKNNISRMLSINKTPKNIQISDNMPIYFDNDLIYDMVTNNFITKSEIPTFSISSGMIIDEPGTGKTLQFILYILETNLKGLVLVPNDMIKLNWIDEFKKHINFHPDTPHKQPPFDVLTFRELEIKISIDSNYLNMYQIIGIDEIHNLYRMLKNNLFDTIVSSNIKYRWGITGTPFVSDQSLFNIIKFLTGYNFKNERISNNPSVQSQFIDLFLKNCKVDMVDDYMWSQLNIHDIKIKLDIVQQNLYDAELMLDKNTMNLRKLVCEINLMFNSGGIGGEFRTPSELKQYGIMHYQKLYDIELTKLEELNKQLENIKEHERDFTVLEYIQRIKHFEHLIKNQSYETEKHRKVAEYFLNSINAINKIIAVKPNPNNESQENEEEKDADSEFCKICWSDYTSPITYLKSCGHYFCKACLDSWKKNQANLKCPMCRKVIDVEDILNIQEICDINNSSKIHELYDIIKDGSSYIIFTQFDKVIDKIQSVLTRNNVTSSTLDNYTDQQVLLLSSEQNAEGINLSRFDKMIIFEPFENNMYNNQVEKQLIARIHRVGRVAPVDVYRFITIGTIEEKIYAEFS
jgi:hypothetical protein